MQIPLLVGYMACVLGGVADVPTPPKAPITQGPHRPKKAPVTGVLNVNRATEAELRLLPGIGRGRARAIVERRSKRPFASLEELARMKGMKGIVRKLRPHLSVQGDTTLKPLPP